MGLLVHISTKLGQMMGINMDVLIIDIFDLPIYYQFNPYFAAVRLKDCTGPEGVRRET
jgi:hypothetical protein